MMITMYQKGPKIEFGFRYFFYTPLEEPLLGGLLSRSDLNRIQKNVEKMACMLPIDG